MNLAIKNTILIIYLFFVGYSFPQLNANQVPPSELDDLKRNFEIISSSSNNSLIRANAYKEIGGYYLLYSTYLDSSEMYLNNGLELIYQSLQEEENKKDESEYMKIKGAIFNNLGLVYHRKGFYDLFMDFAFQALQLNEKYGDERELGVSLELMGIYFKEVNEIKKSISYLERSLKIFEKQNDQFAIAEIKNNIAHTYLENQTDLEKAIQYFLEVFEIVEKEGNTMLSALLLSDIGYTYILLTDYESAEKYLNDAIDFADEAGAQRIISKSYIHFARIHQEKQDFEVALNYLQENLALCESLNMPGELAKANYLLAKFYADDNQINEAIKYGKESFRISDENSLRVSERDVSQLLARLYDIKQDKSNAYDYYKLYVELDDSLRALEEEKEGVKREMRYSYLKRIEADSLTNAQELSQQEAETQKAESELKVKRNQQVYMFVGIGMLLVFSFFIWNRFRITRKQKIIIEEQKSIVDEKNNEIMDSIGYAKRIQTAILPPNKMIKELLPKSFVLYKPKDIVAGDFYWLESFAKASASEGILLAAADCTGHGVPGAMVSVVCNNGLNRSVREYGLTDPGKILDKTRELVIEEFEKSEEEVKDGMDIALVALAQNEKQNENESLHSPDSFSLCYSGAHNPLWIIKKGAEEVDEIKANKQPIGKFSHPEPYKTHHVELNPGDTIYIFSDGYADQFGGEKGKKFKSANFKKLLLSLQNESMESQKELLDKAFEDWRGEIEQVDDVCVIGVRL